MEINALGRLEDVLHSELVGLLVALGSGSTDAGSLSPVKEPPLDGGGIGVQADGPAEGVDFTNHVAFAKAANGRVAAHLANGIKVLCQDCDFAAEAGRRQGGLDASMAGANDENVVFFRINKHGCARRATRFLQGNQ